ncbi:MAG TPA: hypothetical protein VEZ89_10995 [Rubrivivax sp.]|nr:hypothetical protein [Rubrivivax sp.]
MRPVSAFGGSRRSSAAAAVGVPLGLIVSLVLVWATFTPVQPSSREELYEIPTGTFARRMAGDKVEILPDTIRLTLGVNDVLLLRNRDDVPQVFGPALIMPGQSFRLPFEVASTYSFACSAHASGQMSVVVEPALVPGWSTLRWRLQRVQQLVH